MSDQTPRYQARKMPFAVGEDWNNWWEIYDTTEEHTPEWRSVYAPNGREEAVLARMNACEPGGVLERARDMLDMVGPVSCSGQCGGCEAWVQANGLQHKDDCEYVQLLADIDAVLTKGERDAQTG